VLGHIPLLVLCNRVTAPLSPLPLSGSRRHHPCVTPPLELADFLEQVIQVLGHIILLVLALLPVLCNTAFFLDSADFEKIGQLFVVVVGLVVTVCGLS
jgi:hypothetical protein